MIQDEDIRRQLRLGEDSQWEFKQIEFRGNRPTGPRRHDLADEMGAFANADGGTILCGVADDGTIRGMSREQMVALDHLLVEVSTDALEPPLRIGVHHRELDGMAFVLVAVPRGKNLHERDGQAFIRVGATKRHLLKDESVRLAQSHARTRYLWFDEQIVPGTGFETLDERLWEPLLSVAGAADPRRGLLNLRLLARDEAGVDRATVAGILLCAASRFPHRSQMRSSSSFVICAFPHARPRNGRTFPSTAKPPYSKRWSMQLHTATTPCLRGGSGYPCSRTAWRSIRLASCPMA